ncbi:MAG TPA: hypothetical protein VEF04_01535, partial [Blastocatellia bacterium]|nr:hypothetical protein [Blastocatellia bacterium]
MKRIALGLLALFLFSTTIMAQEFEVKKYDLSARLDNEAHELGARAKLRIVNLSTRELMDKILQSIGGDKPRLSFYLNSKAKVTEMKLNGQTVQFRASDDPRSNLLVVSTEITSSFASTTEFDAEFAYTIPVPDRNPALHISTGESYILPSSFWFPVKHSPFAEHGADTAPFTLTLEGTLGQNMKFVSTGVAKGPNQYEQILAAQPLFFVGDYEVLTRANTEGGSAIEI